MSYSGCVGYILIKLNAYVLMPRLEKEKCSMEVVTSKKRTSYAVTSKKYVDLR
jgi:hypothetical protein